MNRKTLARMVFTVAAVSVTGVTGCSSSPGRGPYAPIAEGQRDTVKAQKLNQEAAQELMSEPDKAEELLREALTADLYFGPAHNNLGVIYLARGELYSAAGEFEWARKLMPGAPDPRMNLALTLERAGRTDDALSAYASALEVDPYHIPSIQALTRLQLQSSKTDDQTKARLQEIAMRGTTASWREWAQVMSRK